MTYSFFLYDTASDTLVFVNREFVDLFPEAANLPAASKADTPMHRFLSGASAYSETRAFQNGSEFPAAFNDRQIPFELTRIENSDGVSLLAGIAKDHEKNNMLRLLADNLPDMLWAKDTQGRYLFANRAICNNLLMAKNTSEPIGKTDIFFAKRERESHADDPQWHTFGELCFDSDNITLREMKPMRFEEYGNVKGELLFLEVHKAPLFDAHGHLIGTVGSGRDITRQKQLETELSKANESMKALLDSSIEARFIFDRDGYCIDTNAMATDLSGYSREELIGMHALDLIPEDYKVAISRRLDREENPPYETELLHKKGDSVPVLARGKSMELFSKTVRVAAMINMLEVKQAHRRIEHLAFYDTLTGLPNRTLFMEQLKQLVEFLERHEKMYSALMFIDLDDFKNINDTQGHEAGDELLKIVADNIRKIIRKGDIAARFGGDEFVILLGDIDSDVNEAARLVELTAEKIRMKIAGMTGRSGHRRMLLRSSCSIGIVLFRDHEETPSDLLRQADIALYEAKKAGKNTIRFFNNAMQEAVDRQITLQHEIDIALQQNAFVLYYQPQVDTEGAIIGAEGLCRWKHSEKGIVSPGDFVPFSEKSGQIYQLGRHVLAEACSTLREWQRHRGMAHLTLSVNISAKQFQHPAFLDETTELLTRYGIPPGCLKLELTETIFLKNLQDVIRTLEVLSSYGVIISLDDFGTGFSSLSYLKKLPLHQLKIDQSFIRDILTDENDQAIVAATIAVAEKLNYDVIAEGVETKEQQQLLLEMGCRYYQGYLFGKALSRGEFEAVFNAVSSPGKVCLSQGKPFTASRF